MQRLSASATWVGRWRQIWSRRATQSLAQLQCSVSEMAEATGVKPASDISQAVSGADVVVTMLPQGGHVLAAWTDILGAIPSKTLVIGCSTIASPARRRRQGRPVCPSLDAPVSRAEPAGRQPG